jgi:radical SAM-linked protein
MGRREFGSPLPWDHLHCGVDASFLRDEYEKGLKQEYTPDCRLHGCQKCGLCDFKEVYPKTYPNEGDLQFSQAEKVAPPQGHYRFRLDYSRLGRSRLLSHLELLQMFFRAFNRAGLPLHYSQGFNPSPKVSFSPALPLGTESRAEYLFVDLTEDVDPQSWQIRLNAQLPDGIAIEGITFSDSKKIPPRIETWYTVNFPEEIDDAAFESFADVATFPVTVMRKKKPRTIDAKPQIGAWQKVTNTALELSLITEVSCAGLKPIEIIQAVFAFAPDDVIRLRMVKERFTALEQTPKG